MNNASTPPFVSVPQELFGGLYSEAAPESLPQGASPLCVNCDFIIGEVQPRPGKKSVYYFDGLFIEKLTGFASSIADPGSIGEAPWVNPTNATLDTMGTYAVANVSTAGSEQLTCLNFNFSIPNTQRVIGLEVEVTGLQSAVGATLVAKLLTPGSSTNIGALGTVFGTTVIGSPTENWDLELTPDMLNNPNFAVELQAIPGPPIPSGNVGAGIAGYIDASDLAARPYNGGNTSISLTSRLGNEWALAFTSETQPGTILAPWVSCIPAGLSGMPAFFQPVPTLGSIINLPVQQVLPGPQSFGALVALFASKVANIAPAIVQSTGSTSGGVVSLAGVTPGNTIIVAVNGAAIPWASVPSDLPGTPSDNQGNIYNLYGSLDCPSTPFVTFENQVRTFGAINVVGGTVTLSWPNPTTSNSVYMYEISGLGPVGAFLPYTVDISAVKLKAWLTPNPPPDFNYLKTFSETGGETLTLALADSGVMYQEDVDNKPGALVAVDTQIEPDSFAQSATVDDREFIAISNLQNGTDIPLTYTPPNFDRLSQVGPGAPPSASATSAGSNVVSITQQPKFQLPPLAGSQKTYIVVSASQQDSGTFGTPQTPGNVCAIWLRGNINLPTYTLAGKTYPVFQVGGNVVISGWPSINGNNINNDPAGITAPKFYTLTAVGSPIAGQDFYVALVFTVNFTTFFNNHDVPVGPGLFIQSTIATMTTGSQVPNLEVGTGFQLAGTGGAPPSGYDSNWTVLTTPNASQLQITATSLNGNVAQYSYNLESGAAPVVGETVTVTLTLNGNGVFNVTNAVISSTGAGTFSINLVGANILSSAENGAGIIFGTLFQFDAFTIVGNKSGGTIVTTGVIGQGIRKVCYSFLTRNGFISKPSPILTFDVTSGASAIAIGNLLPGTSNVIARIIHLTAANGGNFYNIPENVTVIDNGTNVINTSTYVNDNTSTSAILSFSDAVLLAGTQIDIEGNNLFECAELGSCVALVPYSNRLFAIGEQNKLTNLLNWSFDGGIQTLQQTAGGSQSVNQTYPAGWTVDRINGAGGSVVVSPIFGNAYQILNNTGSTQASYGMITQGAYLDEFLVPIIQPSTTYSVRLTAAVPTGPTTGNLIVDLFSPKLGRSLGTFSLALSSITTSMAIYTGTMLTTSLAPVPIDLLLRVWAQNILDGVQINIDRSEIFPTEQPNLDQQVTGSYTNNFESFDQVTGVILGTNVNQQPIVSAFVLFDSFYMVKTGSLINISDNNTTEPSGWNVPRTVSAAVGASGVYAVTTGIDEPNSGEEYALLAGRPGAYLYAGGQPIKITEEIQSVWNTINWAAGFTVWIKNDITNRRIQIGVPMKTKVMVKNKLVQNPWMPAGIIPDNIAPMTPNVILECNYKQVNTGNELAGSPEVHRSYSGKLIASEIVRKWSIWSIKSPCASFIKRPDKTAPLFLGNSDHTGKIYDLLDGLLQDDGVAFTQDYITSAFVSTETGQGTQTGVVRMNYDLMTVLIDGLGELVITTLPNSLDTPYANPLLPNLTLPASTDGDVELPVNECASRLFLRFTSSGIDAGFYLKRINMVMHQDPWSPVRGVNN